MKTQRFTVGSAFALALGLSLLAFFPPAASAHAGDPLLKILRRMNRYFHRHEVDGVVIDPRYSVNPTEAIRLSVVSQLLGYEELYKVYPRQKFRRDIVERADFLAAHFDAISSGGPFDGMLGYAFLEAYEATRDPRYLATGTLVVDRLKALRRSDTVLNGGLMAAMALARHYRLTRDAASEARTRDILSTLPHFQHEDGSFPHWCECSKDVHYTAWMAMELILIQRMLDDPLITPMLQRMLAFMEGRVDATGNTRYQEPCDEYPGCVVYYYSVATGCGIDVDTRAFTNELGYTALLFDRFGSPEYPAVMGFLDSLENRGTFADKWDYLPPPDDPYYVWSSADTSIVNMSVIFWSLAGIVSGRNGGAAPQPAWGEDDEDEATAAGTAQPVEGAGRTPRWTAVDSLLLAGADPAAACDAPVTRPPGGGDARGIRGRLDRGDWATGWGDRGAGSPSGLRLGPLLPNPAGEDCEVRFTIPTAARVSLAIYDPSGRLVRELVSGLLGAGGHEVRWDGRDAGGAKSPSGLYLVRLRAGETSRSARVLVMR